MKHSLDDITKYINSLAPEVQDILSDANMDVLRRYEVDHTNHVTTYEFPNGWGVQCWYQNGAYAHDTYPIKDMDDTTSVDGVMQVECWIHTWNVMNRTPYVSTHVVEDIIFNIRHRCYNINDLQKIQTSVECMMERIREIEEKTSVTTGNCV